MVLPVSWAGSPFIKVPSADQVTWQVTSPNNQVGWGHVALNSCDLAAFGTHASTPACVFYVHAL
jgi:hypothetical protein